MDPWSGWGGGTPVLTRVEFSGIHTFLFWGGEGFIIVLPQTLVAKTEYLHLLFGG